MEHELTLYMKLSSGALANLTTSLVLFLCIKKETDWPPLKSYINYNLF